MKIFFFIWLMPICFFNGIPAFGQIWQGDTAKFKQTFSYIQLNAPYENGNATLYRPSSCMVNASWHFSLQMAFNPSSSNYATFSILSDSSSTAPLAQGYVLQIGGINDDICLYQLQGNEKTILIDGINKRLNSDSVFVSILLQRDSVGNWLLFSDTLGQENYLLEGTCFDDTYLSSSYIGLTCHYTSTRASKIKFSAIQLSGSAYIDESPATIYPEEKDILINEILANPLPYGVDFIELYNNSSKTFLLSNLVLASTDIDTKAITSRYPLTTQRKYLMPNSYLTLTTDTTNIQNNYPGASCSSFLLLKKMPSFPDESGTVVLLTQQDMVIDSLSYNQEWHHPILKKTEGVSLERISFSAPSHTSSNWTSAATTSDYGTPGCVNSQAIWPMDRVNPCAITPLVFSPNNDGINDFTTITYAPEKENTWGQLMIYSSQGHVVKMIAANVLLGMSSLFIWQGEDDNNLPCPTGTYIVVLRELSEMGESRVFKQVVILNRSSL